LRWAWMVPVVGIEPHVLFRTQDLRSDLTLSEQAQFLIPIE